MRIAPVEVLGFPRISRTREETTRCASECRGRAGRRAPRRKGAASAHLGLLEPLGLLVLLQHAHHTAVGDLIRKREAETGLGEVVSATDGCGDCAQRPARAFGTRARAGAEASVGGTARAFARARRACAGVCPRRDAVGRAGGGRSRGPRRGVAGARALRACGPPIRKPRRAHVALPEDVPCSPGTPRSDRDGRPRPWAPSRSWRWKPSYACVCVERVEATRVRGMTGAGAPRRDWRDGEEA